MIEERTWKHQLAAVAWHSSLSLSRSHQKKFCQPHCERVQSATVTAMLSSCCFSHFSGTVPCTATALVLLSIHLYCVHAAMPIHRHHAPILEAATRSLWGAVGVAAPLVLEFSWCLQIDLQCSADFVIQRERCVAARVRLWTLCPSLTDRGKGIRARLK